MGLGAFPASDPAWLGMVGMHGAWEANHAMHDCDVMVAIGSRFDDRVTGRLDAFSPGSKKIHIDIDPSSIGKVVRTDIGIVGDAGRVLAELIASWKRQRLAPNAAALKAWWAQIDAWRARKGFAYRPSSELIKPQHAIERLYALTRGRDVYITTEVGQHQMWAAQFFHFEEPNRWMTSGGLGTMGYGLPAAVGAQVAHPGSLVIDIAGDASVQMTMQEVSTAIQFNLPIKVFILNNQWMGMVRQWQQLLHGERYSHSYSDSLPDFVKLAEAYGALGLRAEHPDELDAKIVQMIDSPLPVLFDCRVEAAENCFPMIPSGKAHNEMILGEDAADIGGAIDEAGKRLVFMANVNATRRAGRRPIGGRSRMVPVVAPLAVAAALSAHAAPVARPAGSADPPASQDSTRVSSITVTAAPLPYAKQVGAVVGDITPELQLDPSTSSPTASAPSPNC
jgi:acetolactate synthase-1/2/3 large subunit